MSAFHNEQPLPDVAVNMTSRNNTPDSTPHIRLNSQTEDLSTSDLGSQSKSLTRKKGSDNPFEQSADHLVPPSRSRTNRTRDESPAPISPQSTGFSSYSSRRSSWESNDSRGIDNPFADSRPGSRDGSDEDINTQTVSEKYNILPLTGDGLLLYPEDVEKDDDLHNPDGDEARDCDIFTKRGIANVGGLALITLGLLTLFIGYPAL